MIRHTAEALCPWKAPGNHAETELKPSSTLTGFIVGEALYKQWMVIIINNHP